MQRQRSAQPAKPPKYRESEALAAARGVPNQAVWVLWPYLAWLLPALLLFVTMASGAGGWETLFMFISSPILLPVMAMVAMTPRMMMRRSGGMRSSTTLVSVAMVVHWWSLTIAALSFRASGDSGSVDSVFGQMFSSLNERTETMLVTAAVILMVVSWVGAAVAASIAVSDAAKVRSASGEGSLPSLDGMPSSEGMAAPAAAARETSTDPDRGIAPGWVITAAILVPVLAIVAGVFGVKQGEADDQAMAEQQLAEWDTVQQRLMPVRSVISPAGWYLDSSGMRPDGDEYAMRAGWQLRNTGQLDATFDRVSTLVRGAGWAVTEVPAVTEGERALQVVTDDGYSLWIRLSRALPWDVLPPAPLEDIAEEKLTHTQINMSLTSPYVERRGDYMVDWRGAVTQEELDEVLDPRELEYGGSVRSFAADEWPSLPQAELTSI